MVVQCPQCQQYYEIGESATSVCPLCGITIGNVPVPGAAPAYQADFAGKQRGWLQFVGIALGILVIVVLGVVGYMLFGRGGNALDYVPEDAEFVVDGNTAMLLDSKPWEYSMQVRDFREFIDEFKEELGLDEVDELRGTFAVWGDVPEGPFSAVIVLENGNAEDIYEMLLDKAEDKSYRRVEEDKVDGCDAFTVYYDYDDGDEDNAEFSVVLVSDHVLQLTFGGEIDEIVDNGNDSEIAQEIDRDAIFAVAAGRDMWDKIERLLRGEDVRGVDMEGLGVVKIEVFADQDEVKVIMTGDISDVEVD